MTTEKSCGAVIFNDEDKVLSASKNLQDAFKFTNNKSEIPKSRVIEVV